MYMHVPILETNVATPILIVNFVKKNINNFFK